METSLKYQRRHFIVTVLLLIILISGLYYLFIVYKKRTNISDNQTQTSPAITELPYIYSFNVPGTLYEAGSMEQSTSAYWWVDSGAYLNISDNLGKTVQGNLETSDFWRLAYFKSNPVDTDNGYHPQNIFRLIAKYKIKDFQVSTYFKITNNNFSSSPNRNESNGLLLIGRYADNDNLYYAGVRVDGSAVIKKKINGTYFTLGTKNIFSKNPYKKDTNPNSLPINTWIGLKVEINDKPDGTVNIKLFTDVNKTNNWTLVLEANDDNKTYGGKAITSEGYVGIRTDFMDVEFSNFKVDKI